MWPLKKYNNTYLIKKPVNEVYEQLKKITEHDFKERSSIKGRLLNINPIEFEFYAPNFTFSRPPQIKPFRTDILVTLIEEKQDTRVNTVVKGNLVFPLLFFILIIHMIVYMWANDLWLNGKVWFPYIAGLLMMYFGDRISKNVVMATFEHYIKKPQLL